MSAYNEVKCCYDKSLIQPQTKSMFIQIRLLKKIWLQRGIANDSSWSKLMYVI